MMTTSPHVVETAPPNPDAELPRAIVGGRSVIDVPATQPLLDLDELDVVIERVHVSRMMFHHRACWGEYLLKKTLPRCWRGRVNIKHYERLICQMTKVTRATPEIGARVKRRRWLRRAPRDQQQAALAWLKSLDVETAAWLSQTYRHDDAAQKAEDRWIKRANRQHKAELDQLKK